MMDTRGYDERLAKKPMTRQPKAGEVEQPANQDMGFAPPQNSIRHDTTLDSKKAKPQSKWTDRSTTRNDEDQSIAQALAKRFLKAGNRYHFRDDHQTLAFEDAGERLATTHQDPDVARSMVELAQAKGWTKLDVRGSDEFKRQAWLEASLRGLETNFIPKDVDRARLAELREEKVRTEKLKTPQATASENPQSKTKEPANERQLSSQQVTAVTALKALLRDRGDSEKQIEAAVVIASERFKNNRVYVGKVLDHGPAPFEFKPSNESSHFVKLETQKGERIIWGADLKRALLAGGIAKGDNIAIAYQGQRQVSIAAKERDNLGNVIGERPISTTRNEWAAEKIEKLRTEALDKLKLRAAMTSKQPVVKSFDIKAKRPDRQQSEKSNPNREKSRSR